MKHYFLLLCLLCASVAAVAQNDRLRFRAVEWNCENLFDTVHDYGKDDVAFLPDGENLWTSLRYWRKQKALAQVLLDAGGLRPVDIVALCEVENDSVLRDLTRRTRLAALGYEYVVTESADLRGVDVALLYQPTTFRLLSSESYAVPYDTVKDRPTRDVLHCTGVLPRGDTLDVVVVHFPSRRGGVKVSSPYRERAAKVVRHLTDSLMAQRQRPAVLVMGDCNDEPRDKSLRHMAKGGLTILSAHAAVRPKDMEEYPKLRHVKGTYYFQKMWSRIDNVLLSEDAVRRYHVGEAQIFAPSYLLEEDSEGFPMPFRTYRGPGYHGGVSDHLPLIVDLWY